jgi:hypothetical protein
MTFDPDRMLATLARHGVEFVLIGGVAAALNGSPLVTFDVDITPRRTRPNLARLSAALQELDARVRTADAPDGLPFAHDARSLSDAQIWNLTTAAGDLDITFIPSGTQGFDDLMRDAVSMDLDGGPVVVACLADIVRSKEAAGREKDRAALPLLRRLLEETQRGD